MVITQAIRDAVQDAMGYEVDDDCISATTREFVGWTTGELEEELDRKVLVFDELGGRGVDLANRIDDLRVALAVRRATP